MAEDAGEIGFGTAVGYSDTNGSYTDVAELMDVKLPGIEINDVDATNHGLTDKFRDFTPGLGTAGEIEIKILFSKSVQATLYGFIRTTKYWRINFPLNTGETTASNWVCRGYLKGLQNENPLDDNMTATIKIKLRGKPTFTAGS